MADETEVTGTEFESSSHAKKEREHVVVTDFDMPFGSLVGFMVKAAIAAIPAAIIIAIVYVFLAMVAGSLLS